MPQLSFEAVYSDEHVLEILASATNGRFSGVSVFYLGANAKELIDFGNQIKGFPKSISQKEEIEFGFTQKDHEEFQKTKKSDPNAKLAPAYIGLRFSCTDGVGHPVVFVNLHEDDWSQRSEAVGKASFEIRFEPAQIDNFANEIIELAQKKSGKATLTGIHDDKDNFF